MFSAMFIFVMLTGFCFGYSAVIYRVLNGAWEDWFGVTVVTTALTMLIVGLVSGVASSAQ